MITKTLQKKLKTQMITLVVIPNKKYSQMLIALTKEMQSQTNKLCYVSLNKLTAPLIQTLKKHRILTEDIQFIDGISKTALNKIPRLPNVQYIPAPNALLDLNLALAEAALHKKVDTIIFDSPTTLLIHEKVPKVKKFIHFQTIKLQSLGIKTIFTCLKGDTDDETIKSLAMLVDEVIVVR